MLLCLDVGNSQIFGGIIESNGAQDSVILSFRHRTEHAATSDQLGIFLRSVLRENGLTLEKITDIVIGSVVPDINYSLRSACIKYFNTTPHFVSGTNVRSIQIQVATPSELGADLIANALAALNQYANRNLIIVDFGTATTFCTVSKNRIYHGCTIIAGMRLALEALTNNASQLGAANIRKPDHCVGKTTVECLQSGLYFSHLGAIKEICSQITQEYFSDDTEAPLIIATGGFSYLFADENIFDAIIPDLVFHGLKAAYRER